ncbi:hypothetical protein OCAE111667_23390 [Occultella aeris]|uniref:Uncharacterized protein n=1 Tax=Occultella aeris TaxID=2761496 RepID=A0A7M4DJ03_9MICO|nr:hypothetical protein HALOF300_02106 [Occultella aeris]
MSVNDEVRIQEVRRYRDQLLIGVNTSPDPTETRILSRRLHAVDTLLGDIEGRWIPPVLSSLPSRVWSRRPGARPGIAAPHRWLRRP